MRIHQMGLETGHASFRDSPIAWPEFERNYLAGRGVARVICNQNTVLGWATVIPSSPRAVYAGVGEISIYLDLEMRGQGIGSRLMHDIVATSEDQGYWTMFAHIFPENAASIALHQKAGFDTIGRRRAIGKMNYGPMAGKWRDVLLMERRSTVVGLD
ncbi:N-acetyltransferase family protein [Maritalea sp. P4.10X]|uniref:N-acetyltransferase family protein n=2 Tax=Maritalea mediterranea TaxID=2909667 RepID=A0ABS9ECF9_9HYPH|nr:N-acetyltransferase family protein [Maritalea mediterranea]